MIVIETPRNEPHLVRQAETAPRRRLRPARSLDAWPRSTVGHRRPYWPAHTRTHTGSGLAAPRAASAICGYVVTDRFGWLRPRSARSARFQRTVPTGLFHYRTIRRISRVARRRAVIVGKKRPLKQDRRGPHDRHRAATASDPVGPADWVRPPNDGTLPGQGVVKATLVWGWWHVRYHSWREHPNG